MCADVQPTHRADTQTKISKTTHELIIEQGGRAAFKETDVSDESQIRALIAETVEQFGRLDM
jgi:NAD(P)-dependent dehydrogenase (short-subunit alcohol dehydrogenase family)